jgi:DinB superfamily
MPESQSTNIHKVEDIEVLEALEKYGKNYVAPEREKLIALGEKVYAPSKWTAKDIIQHLIDAERVFSYRAMRFARNDKTHLPGFEENDYAATANASKRTMDELLDEYYLVRDSTIKLFRSFSDEMLMREGVIPSGNVSVLAIGFVMPGHTIHHLNVIKERYYRLL